MNNLITIGQHLSNLQQTVNKLSTANTAITDRLLKLEDASCTPGAVITGDSSILEQRINELEEKCNKERDSELLVKKVEFLTEQVQNLSARLQKFEELNSNLESIFNTLQTNEHTEEEKHVEEKETVTLVPKKEPVKRKLNKK